MTSRHKLLILGAGVYQLPLIRKASEMGFETLVVSPRGNYPGLKLADHVFDFDTTDISSIVRTARGLKLAGVVTTGTDVCLPALGALVDELNMTGPSAAAAAMSSNKVLMKQQFRSYGVPTAKFEVVESYEGAKDACLKIGFPVMIKATDSSGSRGITKASDEASLKIAWNIAKNNSKNGLILVEEYLDGIEFGAQAFVSGNKMELVLAHNDTVTGPPHQTPIGHSMPVRLTPGELSRMQQVSDLAITALGIKDAVCNMDFIMHQGEVMVIEIGARMGATCLPENISVYAGSNVYEYLIHKAVGSSVNFDVKQNIPNAAILLSSEKSGIVDCIHVSDEFKKCSNLIRYEIDVSEGDRVNRFAVGPDRLGSILARGIDSVHAESVVRELKREIKIQIN